MDKLIGSESLMTSSALVRMSQDRERTMQDIARMEYFLASNSKDQPSWYARVMTKMGDKLVVYGTWLKTHYSVRQVYPTN